MDWLEVSLTVDGELAEAVAEVLARYASNGVTTEQGIQHLDDEDLGVPGGPVTVRAYLPADGHLDQARRDVEQALHYLGMIQALPAPSFRTIAEQNWMESWKKHYRPIKLGRRLVVLPAWMDAAEENRIAIKIDPGMAFGTGTHPSTQLCLEFIDALLDPRINDGESVRRPPGATFIDVGCGSGILSIAAMKLGAVSALGVDIDSASIENARANAAVNAIGAGLALEVGSVGEILDGRYGLRSASLVAVNILAPVIARLFGERLVDLLEPGGSMILAGILEGQSAEVERTATSAGLCVRERRQMGDWVALRVSN
jgi:ribosomal protein L11 methyltransferase